MRPTGFPAFHLPAGPAPAIEVHTFGPIAGNFALLSAGELQAQVAAAERAAAALAGRPLDTILATLDAAARAWISGPSPLIEEAVHLLPEITGYSPQVVRRGLEAHLRVLTADAIAALLDDELGDRRVLEDGHRGRLARGPKRIAHILAGNLPGLGFAPIALSLALRSATLVKSAAGDPYSAAAFARSIAAVDPKLGRCVVVHAWRGGEPNLDAIALASPVVVASGSDETIAAVTSKASGRVCGHGHKISFALIDRNVLDDAGAASAAAERLATDIALWDQHGCLSPQVCIVEASGNEPILRFAEQLGAALDKASEDLPQRRLRFEDRAAIAAFRAGVEWSSDPAARLLASSGSPAWTIAVEPDAPFGPTCLNRCLRILAIPSLEDLPARLAGERSHLECAGLACAPERRGAIATILAECGVHRVCALGAMQTPPLGWQQSGRPRVADWVEWSIDEGYEAAHAESR